MPRYFKITRPQGSDRRFAFGIDLKNTGEFCYVDHYEVAMNVRTTGWQVDEMEAKLKPTDGIVYEAAKTESFQNLISALERYERTKPKGKWEYTAPPGLLRVFVFGDDVRHPNTTEDYDKMVKFRDLGFTIVKIEGKEEPKETEAVSNEKVEGHQDPHKGRPLSTYDLPKSAKAK